MKRYNLLVFCLCIIGILLCPSVQYQARIIDGTDTQYRLNTSYLSNPPIRITSDSDFLAQGWPGSGTSVNPFIIEGLEIEHSSHCIEISNTQSRFIIRDCRLVISGLAACIYLYRVEYGDIFQNNITGPSWTGFGVRLDECNGTLIHYNYLLQRISLTTSTQCEISNNIFEERGQIQLLYSDAITISNNSMIGIGTDILVDASSNNIIDSNLLNQSQVRLQGDSYSNQLIENTITFNNQIGLEIQPDCSNNTISWNTLAFNSPSNTVDGGTSNTFDYNYYSDYKGPDWNLDGIGDTPHPIPGVAGSVDLHPLRAPPGVPPPNSWVELLIVAWPLVVVVAMVSVCCVGYVLFRRRYA